MSDMRGRLYSSVALAWRWSRLHNWSDHHALVAETQRASTCVAQLNSPEPAALQEVGESADPGVRFTQPIPSHYRSRDAPKEQRPVSLRAPILERGRQRNRVKGVMVRHLAGRVVQFLAASLSSLFLSVGSSFSIASLLSALCIAITYLVLTRRPG